MGFKRFFDIARNLLAVFGLIILMCTAAGTVFVVKRMNEPVHVIGLKVLKKAGLEKSSVARFITPAPVKPRGLIFPDQGSLTWSGHGASEKRQLPPVLYYKNKRPIPGQWHSMAEFKPVTVQTSKRIVPVKNSGQMVRAVKHAQPGDIILLEPGVYKLKAYNINISSPGTAGMPICVRAKRFGQVLIEFDTFEGFLINAPYWIFENLEIKGVRKNHNEGEHAFHIIGRGKGFVLRNSRIHGFNSILKANGSKGAKGSIKFPDGALIENNTFYNPDIRRTSHPVTVIDVVGGNNWIIRGNFISDYAKGRGDRISYAAFIKGNASGGVFENNLVIGEYRHTGGTRVGLSFGGGGTGYRFSRENTAAIEHTAGIIRNNIVMYCPDVAVYLNESADTKIYNNTLYKTMGIDVRFGASSAIIKNNLMTGRIKERDGGRAFVSNNLIVSSRSMLKKSFSDWFAHPEKADFSLNKQGPFIDKGLFLPEIYDDFCGKKRTGKPDIGAYEYKNQICNLIGKE